MTDDTRQLEADAPAQEEAQPQAEPIAAAPAEETPVAESPVESPVADATPVAESTEAESAEGETAEQEAPAEASTVESAEADAAEADDLEDDQLDEDESEAVVVLPQGPIEEIDDDEEEIQLDWYILKVQSNRERTSAAALKRKVAIEGIEHLFGEIIVPTEKVTEFKNGKKKVVERKIWPGYIAIQMHVNDDTWFAIRETSGIGDFTGASGKPAPMQPHEVAMILHEDEEEGTEEAPKLNIKFAEGDKVKVKDGNFENFEGEVNAIDQHSGKVTIMISIFGRSTPVELEYWQVETL